MRSVVPSLLLYSMTVKQSVFSLIGLRSEHLDSWSLIMISLISVDLVVNVLKFPVLRPSAQWLEAINVDGSLGSSIIEIRLDYPIIDPTEIENYNKARSACIIIEILWTKLKYDIIVNSPNLTANVTKGGGRVRNISSGYKKAHTIWRKKRET